MKPKSVILSAQSHQHDRAVGDAPSIGRVSKMPGTGLPRQRRSQKNRSNNREVRVQKDTRFTIGLWSILLGMGCLTMCVGATWLVVSRSTQVDSYKTNHDEIPQAGDPAPSAPVIASLSQNDGILWVKSAMAVRDPALVEKYFHPGIESPQEVVDFLTGLEAQDGTIKNVRWFGNMNGTGQLIDEVIVDLTGQNKPKARLALLTPDAHGTWKIDFGAFARTAKPPWRDFLENRTDAGEYRVFLASDSYYNGPFKNEQEWTCYRIASPDIEESLYGYCKVDSAQAQTLRKLITSPTKIIRANIEIRRVESAGKLQFEISKVIGSDWLSGDSVAP